MTKLTEAWPKHAQAWHHAKWVWVELVRILREAEAAREEGIGCSREIASRSHHMVTSAIFQGAVALALRRQTWSAWGTTW